MQPLTMAVPMQFCDSNRFDGLAVRLGHNGGGRVRDIYIYIYTYLDPGVHLIPLHTTTKFNTHPVTILRHTMAVDRRVYLIDTV